MQLSKQVAALAMTAAIIAGLTGCSLDAVIWGPEGARVIETTEQLIDAASAGESDPRACAGSVADFGSPDDWDGLAAGEPERFVAEYWAGQVALDPAWSINLELGGEGAAPGRTFPGDVFYRESDGILCVVDIAWATVVG